MGCPRRVERPGATKPGDDDHNPPAANGEAKPEDGVWLMREDDSPECPEGVTPGGLICLPPQHFV